LDVAKDSFHAELLDEGSARRKSFPNNAKGFMQLDTWLNNRGADRVHACLEATGGWSEPLALHLIDAGHVVSLVNPQRIRDFGRSQGLRTKTDAADAALIARFCLVHKPERWTPPSPAMRRLTALGRRREALVQMRVQEENRLNGPESEPSVQDSLRTIIAQLSSEIERIEREIDETIDGDDELRRQRDLLESIPGIARRSASAITAEFPRLAEFRSAKAVAAHAGLCPTIEQSGTSLSRSRLSRSGSARLRRHLYFPALAAIRCNPNIRSFASRLRDRGKRPMVVIAAAMRKLLILAYGVVKSGRPFDPSLTPAHGI
jgi:transposase